jgi:hypothetical protein
MSETAAITPLQLRLRAAELEADGNTMALWLTEHPQRDTPLAAEDRSRVASEVAAATRLFLAHLEEDAALVRKTIEALGKNQLPDIQAIGELLCRLLTASLKRHDLLYTAADAFREGPGAIGDDDRKRLREAGAEHASRLVWIRRNWPWADHARMHRALAAHARGESRPTLDFLDELHAETHR